MGWKTQGILQSYSYQYSGTGMKVDKQINEIKQRSQNVKGQMQKMKVKLLYLLTQKDLSQLTFYMNSRRV